MNFNYICIYILMIHDIYIYVFTLYIKCKNTIKMYIYIWYSLFVCVICDCCTMSMCWCVWVMEISGKKESRYTCTYICTVYFNSTPDICDTHCEGKWVADPDCTMNCFNSDFISRFKAQWVQMTTMFYIDLNTVNMIDIYFVAPNASMAVLNYWS